LFEFGSYWGITKKEEEGHLQKGEMKKDVSEMRWQDESRALQKDEI